MRRDHFLKSLAALAAAGAYPLSAHAGANVKMMIPANPGGGWDGTGRELGKALLDAKVADTVQYENKGGAAGVIGLAGGLQRATDPVGTHVRMSFPHLMDQSNLRLCFGGIMIFLPSTRLPPSRPPRGT